MAKTKLIGTYGKFTKATLGADVTTGTLTAGSLYLIKTVGGTSALPTGATVGYSFYADGTEDITTSGDVVSPWTMTDLCDLQSWGLEFSKDETEVTGFCDDQKIYLAGRSDVTGSSEGTYTIGITGEPGGFANKFIDIIDQAGDGGAITVSTIDDAPIYALLYKQKDKSANETEVFYLLPISVTSFSDSASGSDAQAFSSSFRIAPNSDGVIPALYEIAR